MKKQILLKASVVCLFLFGAISAYSQFSVGARLGLDLGSYSNYSKLKSDLENGGGSSVTRVPHVGFQGGFTGSYFFNKFIGLQAELIVDSKGEKVKDDQLNQLGENVSVVSTIGVTYFTIPILLKGGAQFGKFKIYGLLGPYFAFGLGGKATTTGDGNTETANIVFTKETETGDDNVHYKRADVGLTIGAEPAYKLGPGDIFLDLRYNIGFIDVQNPYSKGDDYYTMDNRSFGISAGYIYKFGK